MIMGLTCYEKCVSQKDFNCISPNREVVLHSNGIWRCNLQRHRPCSEPSEVDVEIAKDVERMLNRSEPEAVKRCREEANLARMKWGFERNAEWARGFDAAKKAHVATEEAVIRDRVDQARVEGREDGLRQGYLDGQKALSFTYRGITYPIGDIGKVVEQEKWAEGCGSRAYDMGFRAGLKALGYYGDLSPEDRNGWARRYNEGYWAGKDSMVGMCIKKGKATFSMVCTLGAGCASCGFKDLQIMHKRTGFPICNVGGRVCAYKKEVED